MGELRRWSTALALLLAVGGIAGVARADEERGAYLELVVNDVPRQVAQVLLRAEDVLVAVDDLAQAGLQSFAGARVSRAGKEYVSLASLRPGLAFRVDERELQLRIDAGRELLARTVVDLRSAARPEGFELRSDASGFLNYSAQVDTAHRLTAFAEAGASLRGNLLYTGLSRLANGSLVRGLSNLTVDDPAGLRRWIAGDAVQAGSLLGGSATLLGLTLQREFSLDPYFSRSALPAARGFAATPSTLQVYVNGALVREMPLQPGAYELLNLPLATGAGSYHTVVRDAFGREQQISGRYYYTSGALAKGLTDYAYSLGLRRGSFGTASFDYGGPALLARHRVGVTDDLTAGGRLELAEGLASGGGTLTAQLPIGELELAGALSGGSGQFGAATSLSYSYYSRTFSAGALFRLQGRGYANLSLAPQTDRPLLQGQLFAGVPLGARATLNADLQLGRDRDLGGYLRASARLELLVARRTALSLSAGRTEGAASGFEFFAGLTYSFGEQTTATAGAARQGSASSASLQAQRTLPQGEGFGYRVRMEQGEAGYSGENAVQLQTSFGRYEARYDRAGAVNQGSVSAAGGLVAIGGDFFLTRPVQDSFALLQVPGVPGVRGYLNNQEVGRTDGRGNLVVPNLLPYYGNRLSIAGTDLPFEYDVPEVERVVGSPSRGGAVVRFGARRLQAVTGRLGMRGADGQVVPAYGELVVREGARSLSSPIGAAGEFYLEGLEPGGHAASAEYRGGTCAFELRVPPAAGPTFDAGQLSCSPQEIAAR